MVIFLKYEFEIFFGEIKVVLEKVFGDLIFRSFIVKWLGFNVFIL